MGKTQGGVFNWNINNFYVVETATGAVAPDEIIPLNTSFDVKVDFDGNGPVWSVFESMGVSYSVKFYAEGIGAAADELDLGTYNGTLGTGPYTAALSVAGGIPTEGVYRLGCSI